MSINCEGERLAHEAGEYDSDDEVFHTLVKEAVDKLNEILSIMSETDKRRKKALSAIEELNYLAVEFQYDY